MQMHYVTLSNGEMVVLEERNERLLIARSDAGGRWQLIAAISRDGVLGYSTAEFAPEHLVRGLRECTV